jgi:hypothetical protein
VGASHPAAIPLLSARITFHLFAAFFLPDHSRRGENVFYSPQFAISIADNGKSA